MAKYSFIVFTNPVEGKESEYNDWYNRQHIPDVLNIPGFVSGQRFRLADADRKSTRLNSSHSGESRMPSSA